MNSVYVYALSINFVELFTIGRWVFFISFMKTNNIFNLFIKI
jgi:hypothetical protein